MNGTYKYQCKDSSILTGYLRQYLVEPLMPLVPAYLPANIITIFSNLFVYASLGLAVIYPGGPSWTYPCIASMLLLYVVGDHLDGMQAKRTATSSPLGEYCDHFLDAFNNGLLLILLMLLFNIQNKYLLIYVLGTSYLAHAAIFYHQYKTGWLVFEKFGSLEAMALIIAIIFSSFFPAIYSFFTSELLGFKVIEGLLIVSSLGALMTFAKSVKDAGGISGNFLAFSSLLAVIAIGLSFIQHSIVVYALLTVYASSYIGTLMNGHLVSGKEPKADYWSPGVMIILVIFDGHESLLWFFLLFLILRTIYLSYLTVYSLRGYWFWSNPITELP